MYFFIDGIMKFVEKNRTLTKHEILIAKACNGQIMHQAGICGV